MSDLSKLQTLTLEQLLDLAHEADFVVTIRPSVRVKYAVSVQLFSMYTYTERFGDVSIKDTLLDALIGFCEQHGNACITETDAWAKLGARKRKVRNE